MSSAKSSETPTFDPAAAFQKLSEGFDVETMQTQVLEGIKQGQQATLDGATKLVETVAKVLPGSAIPFASDFRKSAQASIEFAASVYAAQTEFATNLLKVLVPSS